MESLIWLGAAALERQPPLASHPYAVPAAVHAHAARAGHERLGRPADKKGWPHNFVFNFYNICYNSFQRRVAPRRIGNSTQRISFGLAGRWNIKHQMRGGLRLSMKIADRLKDKRILIWGYGREGKSTERFINTFCSVKKLSVFEGKAEEIDENEYDYIIKSPGIKAEPYREKYTSQTELFLEEFAPQTIGITGTKGKSTTSSMLYHALRVCWGENVKLVGNIGLPCLDYYGEYNQDTVIVFEMSCHQLSHLKYSPHVAVFLNLFEDHLDYYGTYENYFSAKKNITLHQGAKDFFLYGNNVPAIDTPAQKSMISHETALPFQMKLAGEHNQFNARFVYQICTELYHCSGEETRQAIETFDGLPHRMQFVANVDEVDYYDDSISTIPQATIEAIKSISHVKTVLIGGMDRHISYDTLIEFIASHPEYTYILSYESGRRIYEAVSGLPCCHYQSTLSKAVALAKAITPKGGACLLSPAAASYGYFKNFEDRGNAYARLVLGEDQEKR